MIDSTLKDFSLDLKNFQDLKLYEFEYLPGLLPDQFFLAYGHYQKITMDLESKSKFDFEVYAPQVSIVDLKDISNKMIKMLRKYYEIVMDFLKTRQQPQQIKLIFLPCT